MMRQRWLTLLLGIVLLTGIVGVYYFRTPAQQQTSCENIAAFPDYVSTGSAADAVAALNNAHAVIGLPPLDIPRNFYQLDPVQQQFLLLNLEREARHLAPLRMDAGLSQMALAYSRQMLALNFFSHTSPIGGSFSQRVDANPALANHYRLAAENLAGNPVPGPGAIYEYMYDDAAEGCNHRANILNPTLSLVGIGMVRGGTYGTISVQEFLASAPWNPYTGVTSDTNPPHIALQASHPNASHLLVQALTGDDTDSVRVTWFLDHVSSSPLAVGPAWTLDLSHLTPGPHTLLAYAVDGEQNYSVARLPLTKPNAPISSQPP